MPERSLAIAVAQPRSALGDLEGNADRHAALVLASEARVVVFPELSLTGYSMDAPVIEPADERLAPVVRTCLETGAVAFAGAPVAATPGGAHIATLRIDGTGATIAYRKIWLGEAEAATYVAGTAPAVVEVDGWRLGLAICKDTGMDQHAADTATLGMDAYVAGVLEAVDDADVLAARARRVAAAHGVWVAIASFAGSTGGGFERAAGRSGIWRPDGSVAASAGPEVGAFARFVMTS